MKSCSASYLLDSSAAETVCLDKVNGYARTRKNPCSFRVFFSAASPFRFFLSQTFLFLTVIDNTRLVYITTFVKEKIKYFHHIYSSFLLRQYNRYQKHCLSKCQIGDHIRTCRCPNFLYFQSMQEEVYNEGIDNVLFITSVDC